MASIKRLHRNGCDAQNCECPWRLDYRPFGTSGPRQRLFFPTKKAAEKHLAETSAKVSRGEYLDRTKVAAFKEAAEQWFKSKTDRRVSHVADLRARLDKHILPRLGAFRLDQITVGAVEKLRDECAQRVMRFEPSTRSSESWERSFARPSGGARRSAIRLTAWSGPSWRRVSCGRVRMKAPAPTTPLAQTQL